MYCDKCKVRVIGSQKQCPLCLRNLKVEKNGDTDLVEMDIFPAIPTIYQSHPLVFKILNFICIALVIVAVTLNYMISKEHWWFLFAIAGIGCFWLTFMVAFLQRKNMPKSFLYQVVVISGIVVLWDLLTGWNGWSLDFVVPILCLIDLLVMFILSKLRHSDVEDYMVYVLIAGAFGVVPILFYLCGWLSIILPSMICVATSIIFFAGILIFQGDKILEELKRRLHY